METPWHDALLEGASLLDVRVDRRAPLPWPDYQPRTAVRAYRLRGAPERPGAVAVVWDFAVLGGSFGEDDATVLAAAARHAVSERVPLVTVVRSGGTRLQEGMAALVGIPRARLALMALAEAGLPHLSVADQPTTGGIWVSVVSAADLRVAVDSAVVGFSGPRVVEATTGSLPGEDSHTGRAGFAAGLVDAALPADEVVGWLTTALRALAPGRLSSSTARAAVVPTRSGWEQVQVSRTRTRGGRDLLQDLTDVVPLRGGDETVFSCVGRLHGQPVVGVALAATPRTRVTPAGFRLATRAYRLAGRLGLPVLSLVDTPGAEPSGPAENDGLAIAIGEALDALLTCPSPTVALVHGEGGSGGALAAAVADRVLVTTEGWFGAIGPEGASATLRRPVQECADLLRLTPADLLALGFADAVVAPGLDVAATLAELLAQSPAERRERRHARWSRPLPGRVAALYQYDG